MIAVSRLAGASPGFRRSLPLDRRKSSLQPLAEPWANFYHSRMTATVCLIAKDEGPYLIEWLAHYVTLGFDHIVVYDNDSVDTTQAIVNACSRCDPRIELRDWPNRPEVVPQTAAYKDALDRAKTEWIAFFDADELLVLNQDESIHDFLARYGDDAGAIAINWLMFGSSGEKEYRDELQAHRFRLCSPNDMIKSIARVKHSSSPTPHAVVLDGAGYFNDRGEQIELVERTMTPFFSYEFAQLNHYVLRSAEEYKAKTRRGCAARVPGNMNYPPRDEAFWLANDFRSREDTAIDRWVARAAPVRKVFGAAIREAAATSDVPVSDSSRPD